MKRIIGTIALALAFIPLAQAEETVGDKVREGAHEVKKAGRKARQAVITRCADGRHTAKGKAGCRRHGGVKDPK